MSTRASPPPQPQPAEVLVCPGCGGRNRPDATECDWCSRPFVSPGRRLRVAGWQIFSSLLVLALLAALVALGFLNAGRSLPAPRLTPTAVPSTAQPTPAVTPRVTAAPTPTLRPTLTPAALPTSVPAAEAPTPSQPHQARVANTAGLGVVVRAEPGPQARSLGTLREGSTVTLTGAEQTVAARLWREVEDESRRVRGWILADYLQLLP